MSTMETVMVETLSDDAAVARLFDLVQRGSHASDELDQIDAVVYGRLVQAYGQEDLPVLQGRSV